MSEKVKLRTIIIAVAACLLVVGILLVSLFIGIIIDIYEGELGGNGTNFQFDVNDLAGNGFMRDIEVFTENGITSVDFSGRITVDGTADIVVIRNEDDRVVYSESYSDLKKKRIAFKVDGLMPYAYYTLRFSSEDAAGGRLSLTCGDSLVSRPEVPAVPERPEAPTPPERPEAPTPPERPDPVIRRLKQA